MWDKEVGYIVWKDTKCVTAESNQHAGNADGSYSFLKLERKGERKNMPLPIPIYNHNKFMGGVDYSDQIMKFCNKSKNIGKHILFY